MPSSPLDPNRELFKQMVDQEQWAHSRLECAALTLSLLVLNKCERFVRRDNFNGIQRAPKFKCLVV